MNKKVIFGIVIFFAFAFLLYTFANPLEDEEGSKFLNDDGNGKVNNVDNSTDKDNNTDNENGEGKYTISFNTSGGSSVSSIKTENGKIISLSTPTRNGYKFLGWYSNGTKYEVGSTVSKDMTLTARWEKDSTSTNNSNGTTINSGTNNGTNSGSNSGNQGGTSGGNQGGNQGGSTTPSIPEYTIKFNSDGGSSVGSIKVTNGTITSLPTPTRNGYEFLGWYDGNKKYEVGSKITGNISLTAKWKEVIVTPPTPEKTYTITFNTNGGDDVSSIKVTNGTIASLPTPNRSGYNFLGWYNGDVRYSVGTTINGDLTLTALWEKISNPSTPVTPSKPNVVAGVTVSSNDDAVEEIKVNSQTKPSNVVTEIRLGGSVSKRELGGYNVNISLEIPDAYETSDVEGNVKIKILTNEYGINTGIVEARRSGRYYILPIGFNNDAIGASIPLRVEVDWLGTGIPVTYKLYFNGISYRVA